MCEPGNTAHSSALSCIPGAAGWCQGRQWGTLISKNWRLHILISLADQRFTQCRQLAFLKALSGCRGFPQQLLED